jgi:LIVCS family branched-chain amino acid:cation transporter
MIITKETKIALTAGLALFAMFFGAGNLIFPLAIGVHSGSHLFVAWVGFVLAGVGLPFLGLFAVSLYGGNYWAFFNTLGKHLSFIVVTFIILILGPLFGTPRTEDITYGTLQPFLPHMLNNNIFSALYFIVIFVLSYKHTLVVDIIGRFISPVKLVAFITLIIASLITASALLPAHHTAMHTLSHSLSTGYGTMDLLAAFFFCNVAYRSIVHKCKAIGMEDQHSIMKVTLKACLIGAFLILVIYTGFMLSAGTHAAALQNIATPALINRLSDIVLGNFGSLFVCVCVTLACIATAVALVTVSTKFFYKAIFRRKIPRLACLLMVLAAMYMMSILGFDRIMAIALPILNVLYPCIIALCVLNIFRKLRSPEFKKQTVQAAA